MSSSPDTHAVWAAVAPEALLEVLVPLRDEHLHHGPATLIAGTAADLDDIAGQLPGGSTLLVVEDPAVPSQRHLRTSPFARSSQADDVVLGWVRLDEQTLAGYVKRTVALLRRTPQPELPLVLLGPREQRYVDLLDEVDHTARCSSALVPFHWGAERLGRWGVVKALRHGPGFVLFTGHGNAGGWFAYGGVTGHSFTAGGNWADEETTAVMLSLACRTGQPCAQAAGESVERPGVADCVIRDGIAGVVVAALGDPLHADNRALATTLVRVLEDGHRSCGDLLDALRRGGASLEGYAVVGDPALRAVSAAGAMGRCRAVFAPAPDAVLGAN